MLHSTSLMHLGCLGCADVARTKPDSEPVVTGRRIDWLAVFEKAVFNLANVVLFQLESRLRELGKHFANVACRKMIAV